MKRADMLSRITDLRQALKHGQQGETLKDLENLKRSISNSIASSLELEDLKLIPTIIEAVQLAAKNADS